MNTCPCRHIAVLFSMGNQAAGVFNPQKLMGVTTLDTCRAKTFVAENQGEMSVV